MGGGCADSGEAECMLEGVLSVEPRVAENPEALHVTALTALYEFDDVSEGHVRGRREDGLGLNHVSSHR